MEFHFRYNGPKSETKVKDCPLCHTAAREKCVIIEPPKDGQPGDAHEDYPVIGCAHCDAVRNGCCPSHCGVERALELHVPHETDPENFVWKDVTTDERSVVRMRAPAKPSTGESAPESTDEEADPGDVRRYVIRERFAQKADRGEHIDKANVQFMNAASYVLRYCQALPECAVDVHVRGDDVNNLGNVHISINATPLQE